MNMYEELLARHKKKIEEIKGSQASAEEKYARLRRYLRTIDSDSFNWYLKSMDDIIMAQMFMRLSETGVYTDFKGEDEVLETERDSWDDFFKNAGVTLTPDEIKYLFLSGKFNPKHFSYFFSNNDEVSSFLREMYGPPLSETRKVLEVTKEYIDSVLLGRKVEGMSREELEKYYIQICEPKEETVEEIDAQMEAFRAKLKKLASGPPEYFEEYRELQRKKENIDQVNLEKKEAFYLALSKKSDDELRRDLIHALDIDRKYDQVMVAATYTPEVREHVGELMDAQRERHVRRYVTDEYQEKVDFCDAVSSRVGRMNTMIQNAFADSEHKKSELFTGMSDLDVNMSLARKCPPDIERIVQEDIEIVTAFQEARSSLIGKESKERDVELKYYISYEEAKKKLDHDRGLLLAKEYRDYKREKLEEQREELERLLEEIKAYVASVQLKDERFKEIVPALIEKISKCMDEESLDKLKRVLEEQLSSLEWLKGVNQKHLDSWKRMRDGYEPHYNSAFDQLGIPREIDYKELEHIKETPMIPQTAADMLLTPEGINVTGEMSDEEFASRVEEAAARRTM